MDINNDNNIIETLQDTEVNCMPSEEEMSFEGFEESEGCEENYDTEDVVASLDNEDSSSAPKKTSFVQKQIIYAFLAFLLTAALIFGSFLVYDIIENNKEKFSVVGVWTIEEDSDLKTYYVFENDGVYQVNIGGQILFGKYEVEEIESESQDNQKETEKYQVVTLTPNIFSSYETQAVATLSEDRNTLTFEFMYSEPVNLTKTELPEYKLDGLIISHASADEFGVDSFVGDDNIVGSWLLEDYSGVNVTYTFNEDGTAQIEEEFIDNDYTIVTKFKYFVFEDKIYITIVYTDEIFTDGEIVYSIDNGKLILNDLAYEKVE